MATQTGVITINNIKVIECDVSPAISGLSAPVGSLALAKDGSGLFYKNTSSNTDWTSSNTKYFNPINYGAVGDGVTDDSTAISNAITASIASTGDVNIVFSVATYLISSEVSIDSSTSKVNIIGNGAILKSGTVTSSTSVLNIKQAKTIKIKDLNFDFNANTVANLRGLRVGDYTNSKYVGVCSILNCSFYNFGAESSYGIWVQNTPYISGLTGNQNLPSLLVDGCNFYNQNTTSTVNYNTMTNYGIGIRIGEQTDYARVCNCNFNYIRIGVWSEAAANLDLTGCNFLACLPKQSSAYTYGALYVPNTGTNNGKINVVACKFNHMYGYSIYYAYETVERPLTVSSCHFIANATTAIYLTAASAKSTQSIIQNNYFERCSQAFTNSWTGQPFGASLQPFIYLNNQLNISVKNNKFLNDASYAILSANSADYVTAQLNQISNTTGTYSLVGSNNILETGTDKLVYSNAPTLVNAVVGTQTSGDNSTKAASTAYADAVIPSQTSNSGKFLTTNGTVASWATLSGGGNMLSANNLSDVANAITSLNNLGIQNLFLTGGDVTNTNSASPSASGLSFSAAANTRYFVSGYLHVGCNNTGGVKIQFTIPTGATINVSTFGFTTGAAVTTFGTTAASATLSIAYCTVNSAFGQIKIDGEINISSTAGTVSVEFAPATNTQTATVYQLGTNLIVRKAN